MTGVEWLVWDAWNLRHIWERHGMRPEQVEDVCIGDPVVSPSYKNRAALIGPDRSGRILTVVLGPVPGQSAAYYVFSARPASRKERRDYFAAKGQA